MLKLRNWKEQGRWRRLSERVKERANTMQEVTKTLHPFLMTLYRTCKEIIIQMEIFRLHLLIQTKKKTQRAKINHLYLT